VNELDRKDRLSIVMFANPPSTSIVQRKELHSRRGALPSSPDRHARIAGEIARRPNGDLMHRLRDAWLPQSLCRRVAER
jgi:hypothetical protein